MNKFNIIEKFENNFLLLKSIQDIFPKDSSNEIEKKYISNELSEAKSYIRYHYDNYLTYFMLYADKSQKLIILDKELNALFPEDEITEHNKLKLLQKFEIDQKLLNLNNSWVYDLNCPTIFVDEMKNPEINCSLDLNFIKSIPNIFKSDNVSIFIVNNKKKYNKEKTLFEYWLHEKYCNFDNVLSEELDYKISCLFNEKEKEILMDIKENNESYINHPAIGRAGIKKELLNISNRINKEILKQKTNILIIINQKYYLL
jgi:hypothetical protein